MKRHLLLGALLIVLGASCLGQAPQSSPCASFPCVVASISLADQTMPFTNAVIYTPPASGLFRVTYYFEADSRGIGANWTMTWSWTDDLKAETTPPVYLQPGRYSNSGVPAMRVLAGRSITCTVARVSGSGSYSLFATVEQFQ